MQNPGKYCTYTLHAQHIYTIHHLPSFRFSHINRFVSLSPSEYIFFFTHLVMLRVFFFFFSLYSIVICWCIINTQGIHIGTGPTIWYNKIGNHIIFTEICCFLHEHKSDIENALELTTNENIEREKKGNYCKFIRNSKFNSLALLFSFHLYFAFRVAVMLEFQYFVSHAEQLAS